MSMGINFGAAPRLPTTAVTRSWLNDPIVPPAFTILVDSRSELSVVSTRPRAMGMATDPNPKSGCPHTYTRPSTIVVTVHDAFSDRSPSISTALTMSPGLMSRSSGRASAVPPCAAIIPNPANALAYCRIAAPLNPENTSGESIGCQEISAAQSRPRRPFLRQFKLRARLRPRRRVFRHAIVRRSSRCGSQAAAPWAGSACFQSA